MSHTICSLNYKLFAFTIQPSRGNVPRGNERQRKPANTMAFRNRSNIVSSIFSNFSLFLLGGCFFSSFPPSFSQKIHFQISHRGLAVLGAEGAPELSSGAMFPAFQGNDTLAWDPASCGVQGGAATLVTAPAPS